MPQTKDPLRLAAMILGDALGSVRLPSKGEAIAFVLFVASLSFVSKQFDFYRESGKERPVAIREHHPRERPEPEREPQEIRYVQPRMLYGTSSAMLIMGSGAVYGYGGGGTVTFIQGWQ